MTVVDAPGRPPGSRAGRLRQWAPWLVLVVAAVVGLAIGLRPHSAKPTLDARVTQIASELKCPVCDGETVAESSAAPSVEIRQEIRQDLINGQPPAQIIAGFEASYGPGILEKPAAKGIGLFVWLLPVIGLLLGVVGVGLALRRWRGSSPGGGGGAEGLLPPGGGGGAEGLLPPGGGGGVDGRLPPGGGGGVDGRLPPDSDPGPYGGLAPGAGQDAAVEPEGEDPVDRLPVDEGPVPGGVTVPSDGASGLGAPGGVTVPSDGASKRRAPKRAVKVTVTCAGVVLIAGGVTWALAASTGHRLPGEEITGQALGADQVEADLQAAQTDEQKNPPDVSGAVKEYQAVLDSVPDQVEALTGEGWLLAETGQPALFQKGLALLQQAETVEPDYSAAHVYRGLALLAEGDDSASVPELEWYLDHDPDPTLKPSVEKALAQAEAGAKSQGAAPASG